MSTHARDLRFWRTNALQGYMSDTFKSRYSPHADLQFQGQAEVGVHDTCTHDDVSGQRVRALSGMNTTELSPLAVIAARLPVASWSCEDAPAEVPLPEVEVDRPWVWGPNGWYQPVPMPEVEVPVEWPATGVAA